MNTKPLPQIHLAILLCAFILLSCKARRDLPLPNTASSESEQLSSSYPSSTAPYKWYCFTDGNIFAIDLPRKAPPQGRRPWTEAVRVSAMCGADGDGTAIASAYALVNRLGMVEMTNGDMRLHQDASVFVSRTAGPLAFSHNVPIFSVYRNTLFNKQAGQQDDLHLFLVQFDPATHIFYPVISCSNIGLDDHSEVVDYVWNGKNFICCVKTVSNAAETSGILDLGENKQRTQFSYYSISTSQDITSITPQEKEAITVLPSSKEIYRKERMTETFRAAPKRLRSLMDFLTGKVSFIVTVSTIGGYTPRGFVSDSGGELLNAYSILGDTYVIAMFGDGTTYLEGTVTGVKRSSDATAFRLPRLPEGWAYTSLAVSGVYLYAAWEETDFYETGRAGLISVDLSKVFAANGTTP